MITRSLGITAAGLLLASCALLPSWMAPPPPAPPLLTPASLGGAHAASQILHIAYGDRVFTLQCALQADAGTVILVAIGALGQRAFSLRYDGFKLDAQTSPYAPPGLPAARVLSDVQLALWPLAAWQNRLQGSAWTIAEPSPGVRQLFFRHVLVERVDYQDADPWRGRIKLQNRALNYSIGIEAQPINAGQ